MQRVSVLIAGAGPAGVVAALKLVQRGVEVLLVEALAACPEDMRASTLHPPTLDMLEALGLLDGLEAQGLRAPVYQYRNRTTGEVIALDLSEVSDVVRYPYRLQCEQFKLTRAVAAILADHPHGRILYNHRIVDLEQDDGGVVATLEGPHGLETIRADYLIGTDGAGSTVRKRLEIEFDGFTYPEKFLTLSTAWPLQEALENLAYVAYMADPKEWCVLLRVPDWWRVLVPAPETAADSDLTSDARKSQVFDGLMGDGATVETHHRTLYRIHQRVARTYRRGRVLLAGDAAHLNNPLGGFGMNSGVHDAWNLADKLSAVILEGADADTELDRYDRQRRTVMHEFVQAQTIRNRAAMDLGGPEAQAQAQAQLQEIADDPVKRRDYLLRQAMVQSLQREAQVA